MLKKIRRISTTQIQYHFSHAQCSNTHPKFHLQFASIIYLLIYTNICSQRQGCMLNEKTKWVSHYLKSCVSIILMRDQIIDVFSWDEQCLWDGNKIGIDELLLEIWPKFDLIVLSCDNWIIELHMCAPTYKKGVYGICQCHTKRRLGWVRPSQSFFWYDID